MDVLETHVWHQGTIYKLTQVVLPFVLELVDLTRRRHDDKGAEELAGVVVHCAQSAREFAQSTDQENRALGEAVLAILTAEQGRLRSWKQDSVLREYALAAMLNIPALWPGVLACDEVHRVTEEEVLATILGRLPHGWFDATVLDWAARKLEAKQHPVTQAAAQMLAEAASGLELDSIDAERIAAVGSALGSQAMLDDLRERFGFNVKRKSLAIPGETTGRVVLAEVDWFVIQVPRNLTVRWPAHPFAEGDTVVLVDINKRSIPREVRGTGAKAGLSARFDDAGRKL
jgi:hypothetical protein